MTKITAIIPTYNEEVNIQKALESVEFADEVIVIDSYSTDNTLEIVKKTSAKILQREFDNFSNQKNYAISKASNSWVFLLDADETVSKALRHEVLSVINSNTNFSAFYIYRNYFYKNLRVKYSGWRRDKVIRLFKKEESEYAGKVHEEIVAKGEVGFLSEKINHYSYRNYKLYKTKLQKYARLQAEELLVKGKIVTPYHLVLKPFIRFFIQFFIQLGFLDGYKGFVISYVHAYGVYRRYVELLNLKRDNRLKLNVKTSRQGLTLGYDAKRVFHNTTGLGNYSRDLLRILAEYYPENNYLLYNPKPKKIDRLKITNSLIEVLPTSSFWSFFYPIWRQIGVKRQVRKDKIEIFHGLSGELPIGLKKTKKIVTIHDLIFVRYPHLYGFFERNIYFLKFKRACNQADKIIAISNQTKQDIINLLKIDEKKIEVIYQGCHTAFKEKKSEEFKQTVISNLKLPQKFILNVGTIEERKNLLSVVKAIKDIDVNLVVVGKKTKYYDKIRKYINNHNLSGKIFFIEGLTLDELSSLYQSAILTTYVSFFEGFGIPIIESLYSKTPVITTKGGVFPEAGGPNSIYINPNSIEELKKAILFLLESKDEREKIAEEGLKFVQKFNDDIIAEKYMKIYSTL